MHPVGGTPTDLQLALCALHADLRTLKLRKRLAKFIKAQLHLQARFSAEFHGVRLVLFTGEPTTLPSSPDRKTAPAVLAFRGTKLHRAKTVAADLQLLLGAKRDLSVCVTARKLVDMLVNKLERAEPDVDWHFYATGHSLGGFLSLTTMIYYPEKVKQVVAFESPGLTKWYYDLAMKQGDEEWWRERVRLYLGLPNPINMCNRHLGRLFQVDLHHERKTDAGHMVACLLSTSLRTINWLLASKFAYSSVRTCFAVSAAVWACVTPQLRSGPRNFHTLTLTDCALPVALTPLAAAAFWALQSTSAFLACRLGTTIKHILVQHSMVNMVRAFDHTTGMPYSCIEMASWPSMATVSGAVVRHIGRALIESFVPLKTAEGLGHMFDMTRILKARIQGLPGYLALPPQAPSLEAACQA